ncbi:MAG: acyltransferase [Edaphobacter sp.]
MGTVVGYGVDRGKYIVPDPESYTSKMRDLPNLDFVRSVAVISVVVEHTLLALRVDQIGPFPVQYFGVLGVLVFFVLTALVLMWSLERKPHTLDFYIRRWFRIYPLAILSIVAALIFHAPTSGTITNYFQYQHPHLRDVVVQMALVQDLIFVNRPTIGVLWTLPYEVQMYLLLPVLFFFVQKNFSTKPLLVLWIFLLLLVRHVPADGHNFGVAMGYFLPGVMAYIGFGRWKPNLPAWLLPVFLLVLWLMFLPRFDFHKGWGFCLIFALGLPFFKQIKSEIVLAPSRQIAKYSYGIYLMHSFAIVIGMYLFRGHSLAVRLAAELVPLVVLPILAYHLVEHPMIRLGARLAARAEKKYEQRELKYFRKLPAA